MQLPNNLFKHRGEAALRINCDTLDTFRTKECKELIERVKINNLQQEENFQYIFPFLKYTDCVKIINVDNESMKTRRTLTFIPGPKQRKSKTEIIPNFHRSFDNFVGYG